MKKIMLIALSAVLLTACGSEKSKDGDKDKTNETTPETPTAAPAATGKDAELTKWLSDKMLVSTEKDPKYDMWNNLKKKADGTCPEKDNESPKWKVNAGQFIFKSVMEMKEVIEKRAEDTLVFKGEYGPDRLYVLKPIN